MLQTVLNNEACLSGYSNALLVRLCACGYVARTNISREYDFNNQCITTAQPVAKTYYTQQIAIVYS